MGRRMGRLVIQRRNGDKVVIYPPPEVALGSITITSMKRRGQTVLMFEASLDYTIVRSELLDRKREGR